MEKRGTPLIKWQRLAVPKELGRWGLKFFYHFATALSGKNEWRLITCKGLWFQVIVQKYIAPASVDESIR